MAAEELELAYERAAAVALCTMISSTVMPVGVTRVVALKVAFERTKLKSTILRQEERVYDWSHFPGLYRRGDGVQGRKIYLKYESLKVVLPQALPCPVCWDRSLFTTYTKIDTRDCTRSTPL